MKVYRELKLKEAIVKKLNNAGEVITNPVRLRASESAFVNKGRLNLGKAYDQY